MPTNTITSPVLFTLTSLLILSACGDADDSDSQVNIDDTSICQDGSKCDTDTADPPATMQLAYEISELGVPQGDVIDTHLGDQHAKSGNATASGTILTLAANTLTWLTAGDASNLVEGEVTPKFEDEAGLWATMPRQLYFDDVAGTLSIFSPTYDPECGGAQQAECEATLSTYPIPDGVMTLTANLNLWFDLGAATCTCTDVDGNVDEYDQDDLIVEYGHILEVFGVTDSDIWLEVAGDQLQLGGTSRTVTSSNINQKDGIVTFSTSGGDTTTCK